MAYERRNAILADREAGMKYREIAEKHGVSYQRVAHICGKNNPHYFRFITEKTCTYPALRHWMNENKVSRAELLRRMYGHYEPTTSVRFRDVLNGKADPTKRTIDRLLNVTGMTYEQLFYMDGRVGE
jgi:hypothetical protein